MTKQEQLERARRQLEIFMKAEEEVAVNQHYSIAGRIYTRANLAEIGERIVYWTDKVTKLEAQARGSGRNRIHRVIPRDL